MQRVGTPDCSGSLLEVVPFRKTYTMSNPIIGLAHFQDRATLTQPKPLKMSYTTPDKTPICDAPRLERFRLQESDSFVVKHRQALENNSGTFRRVNGQLQDLADMRSKSTQFPSAPHHKRVAQLPRRNGLPKDTAPTSVMFNIKMLPTPRENEGDKIIKNVHTEVGVVEYVFFSNPVGPLLLTCVTFRVHARVCDEYSWPISKSIINSKISDHGARRN